MSILPNVIVPQQSTEKKILRMPKTTYPGMTAEASDMACLRDLTKLSILIRVFVEMHEFSGSFSPLTLYIKRNSTVEEK